MVAGFWYNQDGLPLQYGTQKAIPDVGGDFLVYGDTREIETYVALVPTQFGSAGVQIPACPTTFSGTGTPIQAGVQSLTTFIPLQTTAVNTGGSTITFTATQMFIEQVETEVLIAAAGGTSLAIGLVTTSQLPGSPNATFTQVTPNAGTQILKNQLLAQQSTVGNKVVYTNPGTFGFNYLAPGTLVAGGGDWVGVNMPLVTNTITPLPQSAWLSAIATGAYTNGLIKVRIRYTLYGEISF
jgi:hypothetical protein